MAKSEPYTRKEFAMSNKVNRYNYEVIYALHNITKDYLQEINDQIKEKGINEVISCNDDKNITVNERKAKAKYSKEDQAKIDEFKSTFTPINEGAKDKYVTVAHLSKSTNDKIDKILAMLEDQQDNKVIQRVASILKDKKK
mgnify:FL=1